MPAFRVTGGVLRGALVSDAYPDNTLPGVEGPVDPGWGISSDRPSLPIVLPPAPPGIWPPPTPGNPIAPIIDNTLPVPPGVIWPSPNPPTIDNTLPGGRPPVVDNTLPGSQPGIDNTLPGNQPGIDNTLPSQTYWMLAYCPSLGWKYVSVDPSLRPGMPLPPYAQPK